MGRDYETSMGGGQQGFKATLWTTILKARNPQAPDRREALEKLIQDYWKPAYFFIRRRGHDVESAKDLTQAFFATFLEREFLKSVDPSKGRFRSFLLAALTHFLSNEYDKARALKRGGGFNFVEAEDQLPSAAPGPEDAYFDRWTADVLERAIARLKKQVSAEEFSLLNGDGPPGLADHEKKNRRRRLRTKLRSLIRAEILPSVQNEGEADAELRELLQKSSHRV